MLPVILTAAAKADLHDLPLFVLPKVQDALQRLGAWPAVSGAKPLRGERQGSYRLRVRDYRIVFHCEPNHVRVERIVVTAIGNRRDVYED